MRAAGAPLLLRNGHRFDERFRTHVNPVNLYPVQADLLGAFRTHGAPTTRRITKSGPDAVLALGIYKHKKLCVCCLERVGHYLSNAESSDYRERPRTASK